MSQMKITDARRALILAGAEAIDAGNARLSLKQDDPSPDVFRKTAAAEPRRR